MPDDEQKQVYLILDALIRDYKIKKSTPSKQQKPDVLPSFVYNTVNLKAYFMLHQANVPPAGRWR